MILIATCSEYPHPTPNLEALIASLRSAGAEAAYLPRKETPLDTFAAAEAVLPLCCWDYTIRRDFLPGSTPWRLVARGAQPARTPPLEFPQDLSAGIG